MFKGNKASIFVKDIWASSCFSYSFSLIHACIHKHLTPITPEHLEDLYSFCRLTSHMLHPPQAFGLPIPFCSAKSSALDIYFHFLSFYHFYAVIFSLFFLGLFLYRQINEVSFGGGGIYINLFFYHRPYLFLIHLLQRAKISVLSLCNFERSYEIVLPISTDIFKASSYGSYISSLYTFFMMIMA